LDNEGRPTKQAGIDTPEPVTSSGYEPEDFEMSGAVLETIRSSSQDNTSEASDSASNDCLDEHEDKNIILSVESTVESL
jgi:hypothetical protein